MTWGDGAGAGDVYIQRSAAGAVTIAGALDVTAGMTGAITSSATAPVAPGAGALWFNSTTGTAYIYYNDGTSSQWVQYGSSVAGATGATGPAPDLTGPITSVGAATSIASQTGTGTTFVVNTSPTLVTPVLGVAAATSINSTTIPSSKTLVVTTDTLAVLGATTSAQLAGVISDETGSGALVFGTSPTISTPIITVSINVQTGTTFTPVLSDAASIVTLNNASAIAVTIPTNAVVAYAIGSQLNFVWRTGAGQPTITAVTPATTTIISTGASAIAPKLRVANSVATAIKIDTDVWLVTGDIA